MKLKHAIRQLTAPFLVSLAAAVALAANSSKPAGGNKPKPDPKPNPASLPFPEAAHVARQLDFTRGQGGLEILKQYSGQPDAYGVFEIYELVVPAFQRATYYRSGFWPMGANQMFPAITNAPGGKEGGFYLLLQIAEGDYLAVLPLCGDHALAWLSPKEGKFRLKLGHFGTAPLAGINLPLCAWARAANPYEASGKVWKAASECEQLRGNLILRQNKKLPEPLEYLGWCSWNAFGTRIDEPKMIGAINALKAAPVPVRFFLMDDGHYEKSSAGPSEKFPNGYKPLTA